MNGYIEVNPLPERCVDCKEDCYNCDFALDRWKIPNEKQLKRIIHFKITRIKLLQQQLQEAVNKNKNGRKDKYIYLLNKQIKELKKDIVKIEDIRGDR